MLFTEGKLICPYCKKEQELQFDKNVDVPDISIVCKVCDKKFFYNVRDGQDFESWTQEEEDVSNQKYANLKYKGYTGVIDFDADSMFFVVTVWNNDSLSCHADDVEALKSNFEQRIDEYLAMRETV